MFSHEKGYKIRAKVHGKGGILLTSILAYAPLLDWTAVAGQPVWISMGEPGGRDPNVETKVA